MINASVVPNLFTVANMALGFFAIVRAIQGDFVSGPIAIFVAHFFDIIDGRLARWIGSSSSFGGEFDSFADWVSFGIAPALMVYLLALKDYGKLGFLLAFFFILCGALRLARFNLKAMEGSNSGPSLTFTGLPTPGAGGFLSVLVLLMALYQAERPGRTLKAIYQMVPAIEVAIPVIVFSLALLMISKVQYSTFKKTHLFRPQSLRTFIIILFVCFMVYAYPQNTIFILYTAYILWGLINTGWRAYRLRQK